MLVRKLWFAFAKPQFNFFIIISHTWKTDCSIEVKKKDNSRYRLQNQNIFNFASCIETKMRSIHTVRHCKAPEILHEYLKIALKYFTSVDRNFYWLVSKVHVYSTIVTDEDQ